MPDKRDPAREGADQIMTAARRLADSLATDAEREVFWGRLAQEVDAVRVDLEYGA